MTEHSCGNDLHFQINVQAFSDTNIKYLEVSGHCNNCGRRLVFRGQAGLNPAGPTVALDGSEGVFPFLFDGETYDGKGMGFAISTPGGN